MPASSLYTHAVLEHYRSPRNFGELAAPTHAADGTNPLCGDSLRIELRCEAGRVADLRFRGEACAIATATASMLGGIAIGRSAGELAAIEDRFARLIRDGAVEPDEALGELNVMRELAHHPVRRKCALLPFATLRAALSGAQCATTEGNT
ncbi:MAG TPA: SUF system NifU family Fe-S cluster assembly protein [Rudaea sp.]|nr:SUF system NifU family Fe-S cluster assembly protein [Rudaea sp.]